MASKYGYQVKQIPSGATTQQIEDALNTYGAKGWEVIQFIQIGSNLYVTAKKILVQ